MKKLKSLLLRKMYSDISYQKDFITLEQEKEIIKIIPTTNERKDDTVWKTYRFGNYIHPYNTYYVSKEIPSIFNTLNIPLDFNSVTINVFKKDQYIPFHIDPDDAEDKICVLSLIGNSELNFRNIKGDTKTFNIEPRSFYVMENDFKTKWQHSTIAKEDRISIVFRKSKSNQNDR